MARLTEEQLKQTAEKIKQENGVDHLVYVADGDDEALCIPATGPIYERWAKNSLDANKRHTSNEQLFRALVKYPAAAGVEEMLRKRPGLVNPFAEAILEDCGTLAAAVSKKL